MRKVIALVIILSILLVGCDSAVIEDNTSESVCSMQDILKLPEPTKSSDSGASANIQSPPKGEEMVYYLDDWEAVGSGYPRSDGVNFYIVAEEGIIKYNKFDQIGTLLIELSPLEEEEDFFLPSLVDVFQEKLIYIYKDEIICANKKDGSDRIVLCSAKDLGLDEDPIRSATLYDNHLLIVYTGFYRCVVYDLLLREITIDLGTIGGYYVHGDYVYYHLWRNYHHIQRTNLRTGIDEWYAGYIGHKYRVSYPAPSVQSFTFVGEELYYTSGGQRTAFTLYKYIDGIEDQLLFDISEEEANFISLEEYDGTLYFCVCYADTGRSDIYKMVEDEPELIIADVDTYSICIVDGFLFCYPTGIIDLEIPYEKDDYSDIKGQFAYNEPFIAEDNGYTYYISSQGIMKHDTATQEAALLVSEHDVFSLWIENGKLYYKLGDWSTNKYEIRKLDLDGKNDECVEIEEVDELYSNMDMLNVAQEFLIDGQKYYTTFDPYGIYRYIDGVNDEAIVLQPNEAVVPYEETDIDGDTYIANNIREVNRIVNPVVYDGEIYYGIYEAANAKPKIYKVNPKTNHVTLVAEGILPYGMMMADNRIFHSSGHEYTTKGIATKLGS